MPHLLAYGLMIVLGLVAYFGVMPLYAQYDRGQKVQDTHLLLSTIRTEVSKKYQYQPNGFGTAEITGTNLIIWGAVPSWARFTTTEVRNRWNGVVQVVGATDRLNVSLDQVPREACIALLSEQPADTGIIGVSGGASVAGALAATVVALPMSPDTATTTCANATNNAVRFQLARL